MRRKISFHGGQREAQICAGDWVNFSRIFTPVKPLIDTTGAQTLTETGNQY